MLRWCYIWDRDHVFLNRSGLGEVGVAALLFEELGKVGLAIDVPVEGSIGRGGQLATSVRTPKAQLVVKLFLHRHLPQMLFTTSIFYQK